MGHDESSSTSMRRAVFHPVVVLDEHGKEKRPGTIFRELTPTFWRPLTWTATGATSS